MNPDLLPPDLAAFRNSYADLFGQVPPLPDAKLAFSSMVDPQALRFAEESRAHAFHSTVFDMRITQLLLFGMLLATGAEAARFHGIAARRAGAAWEELHKVAELASVVVGLGPLNQGSALLAQLRSGAGNDPARPGTRSRRYHDVLHHTLGYVRRTDYPPRPNGLRRPNQQPAVQPRLTP